MESSKVKEKTIPTLVGLTTPVATETAKTVGSEVGRILQALLKPCSLRMSWLGNARYFGTAFISVLPVFLAEGWLIWKLRQEELQDQAQRSRQALENTGLEKSELKLERRLLVPVNPNDVTNPQDPYARFAWYAQFQENKTTSPLPIWAQTENSAGKGSASSSGKEAVSGDQPMNGQSEDEKMALAGSPLLTVRSGPFSAEDLGKSFAFQMTLDYDGYIDGGTSISVIRELLWRELMKALTDILLRGISRREFLESLKTQLENLRGLDPEDDSVQEALKIVITFL